MEHSTRPRWQIEGWEGDVSGPLGKRGSTRERGGILVRFRADRAWLRRMVFVFDSVDRTRQTAAPSIRDFVSCVSLALTSHRLLWTQRRQRPRLTSARTGGDSTGAPSVHLPYMHGWPTGCYDMVALFFFWTERGLEGPRNCFYSNAVGYTFAEKPPKEIKLYVGPAKVQKGP
jgi:hypothetical protein